MLTTFRRSFVRCASGSALSVALLVACGGGEILAILQIVTPLAGAWDQEGGSGQIIFQNAESEDALFSSKVPVQLTMSELPTVCGTDDTLNGELDSGRLTVFPTSPASTTPCVNGVFTDLRRLELTVSGVPTKLVYLNDRVAVNMQRGVWVSENGQVRLSFKEPSTVNNNETSPVDGCDVSNPATPIGFSGTMSGFNTSTGARPGIAELKSSSARLFSSLDYVDGDTITLRNAANEGITLTRKNEQVSCP